MHHSTHIANGETQGLAGPYEASPLRPAGVTREPVILVFSQRPAARCVLADAMEPDEGFESLGSIAVRLVASFRRPKMTLVQNPRGRGSAPAAHDPSWEDSDA
jgi:hypothetical protein